MLQQKADAKRKNVFSASKSQFQLSKRNWYNEIYQRLFEKGYSVKIGFFQM